MLSPSSLFCGDQPEHDMVDIGVLRQRGGNAGDATRKQQMTVENAILDTVKKRLENKGNMDPSGREGGAG